MKEIVSLNQKEQQRVMVLNRVECGELLGREGATLIELSLRQTRRLLAAYRKEGVAALAHGNRGRCPVRALPEETKEQVIALARGRYAGCNHHHLTELLAEREGIVLSRSSVWRVLTTAGVKSPRRHRPPSHRCRRERYPQEGMLLQIDGSYHDWLEGRGPWLTLLMAVDDATGTVPYALFWQQEDAKGYFLLFWGIIERCGIPLAVYSDRHAVFKDADQTVERADDLPTTRELTQFGRALQELGVGQVFARSPEAKGRVERMAGTFQDRLVSELRLAGASTQAEANRVLWQFLPGFNARFGVPPAQSGCAYRPVTPDLDLAGILCTRHSRKVARDNTVKYNWRTLQLLPGTDRPSYAGMRVEVQERLNGTLAVCYQGQVVPSQEAPPRAGVLRLRNDATSGRAAPFPCLGGGVTSDRVGGQGQVGRLVLGAAREEAAASSTSPVRLPGAYCFKATGAAGLSRRPTLRQQARWDAIQEAKRQGLPLRGIARYLGISRNTVRKYLAADGPPIYPMRRQRVSTTTGTELATCGGPPPPVGMGAVPSTM